MPKQGTTLDFLYRQLFVTPTLSPALSFTGQTVIVTGSNVGLGFSAAEQIAQRGASKVILAVRTVSKGEAAAQKIRSRLSASGSRMKTAIEVWPLDLSKYQSVKDFAARATNELDRLDVLLENAGVGMFEFTLQEEDEASIKTNVLSTTLLALLLLPKLRETASRFSVVPRLVIVSSNVGFMAKFNERHAENIFEELNNPKSDMQDRYNLSKLLEAFIVRELAPRISENTSQPLVILNTLSPGACKSDLMRNTHGLQRIMLAIQYALIARTQEVGARTLVHAAGAGRDTHGKFLSECEVYISAADPEAGLWENAEELQKRIWSEVVMKLEKVSPGVSKNI